MPQLTNRSRVVSSSRGEREPTGGNGKYKAAVVRVACAGGRQAFSRVQAVASRVIHGTSPCPDFSGRSRLEPKRCSSVTTEVYAKLHTGRSDLQHSTSSFFGSTNQSIGMAERRRHTRNRG
jgi:hypothetical protein